MWPGKAQYSELATALEVRGSNAGGGKIFRALQDRPWDQPSVLCSDPVTGPGMAQRVGRSIALLFHDRSSRKGDEWSAARPGRTLPPGRIRYAF